VSTPAGTSEERLTLSSRIADLALLPPWIERLASLHVIPEDSKFAVNLCLEEAISNVIRHGYANEEGHPILIRFSRGENHALLIMIEDQAPAFNPLLVDDSLGEEALESRRTGGLGIRLLRTFASSLKYERVHSGNRLTIEISPSFPAGGNAGA
jgi:anti-sigma regulatory factor (Ser/Thr protein kinase)